MDLLDFARGPALVVAVAVFVLGTAWRLWGVLRLPRLSDLSPPRDGAPPRRVAVARALFGSWQPRPGMLSNHRFSAWNAWAFHLGLAVVFFGYAPHIAFIRRVTGLAWPALPDAVMYLAAALAIVSLLVAGIRRLSDPVLASLSGAEDWISWTVTLAPVITGMAVMAEPSSALLAHDHALYRMPLAVHLLSLELLLVWFPFGKLMHAVLWAFSRGATGMRFSHRGVQV